MAKEMEPQLRKLTENVALQELQRAASERESELFRRRTILMEEDAAIQQGNILLSSPFKQPFTPPSASPNFRK